MCTYLTKRGSTYYFRFPIPLRLRPAFGGKAEIVQSLRTKDREHAKDLLPAHTNAARAELRRAEGDLAKNTDGPEKRAAQPHGINGRAERQRWEYEMASLEVSSREAAEQEARQEARADLRKTLDMRMTLSTQQLEPWEAAVKDALGDRDFDLTVAQEQIAYLKWRLQAVQQGGGADALATPPQADAPASLRHAVATTAPMLDTTVVERWATERQVTEKTKDAHRAVAKWFYGRVGSVPVADISRANVLAFKDALLAEGQSPQNVNVKLSRMRTLLQWAADNDLATKNVAHGVSIKGQAAAPKKRLPFDETDLQAIFSNPIYSEGARPKQGRGEAAYWLPLLALFTGARLEELGQLRPSDIQKISYPDPDGNERPAWFLRVTTLADEGDGANQLKNEESERVIPVHPELERLGFIGYALAMKKMDHARIFPLLTPGAYDRLTAKWGEWFGPYLRTVCGITDKRKVFHSFRHTFKHFAGHVGMLEGVQRDIMGHSPGDVADDYRGGYSKHQLVEGMKVYRIAGLTLPKPEA